MSKEGRSEGTSKLSRPHCQGFEWECPPQAQKFEHMVSSRWWYSRKSVDFGGRMLLEDFQSTLSGLCFWLRCKSLPPAPEVTLAAMPHAWTHPLKPWAKQTLFFSKSPWLRDFITAAEKITNIICQGHIWHRPPPCLNLLSSEIHKNTYFVMIIEITCDHL